MNGGYDQLALTRGLDNVFLAILSVILRAHVFLYFCKGCRGVYTSNITSREAIYCVMEIVSSYQGRALKLARILGF